MLAEAKAHGRLAQAGLAAASAPIVYASWDGEEPGLLGSTEWAETHAKELQQKAVVYVNSDTNASRLPVRGRQPFPAAPGQSGRGGRDRSGDASVSVQQRQRAFLEVHAAEQDASPKTQESAQTRGRKRRHSDRAAGLGFGLQRVPGTPRHRHAGCRLRRRGRSGRRVPLALRRLRALRPFRRSGLQVRSRAGARWPGTS